MWLMNIHVMPPVDSLQCTCMVSHTETGVCVLLLMAVIAYFPSRPPSSPSVTAAIGKLEFKEGMRDLFRLVSLAI